LKASSQSSARYDEQDKSGFGRDDKMTTKDDLCIKRRLNNELICQKHDLSTV
jgi:hypothetical protein